MQATSGSLWDSRSNLSRNGFGFLAFFERLELVYIANVCVRLPFKSQIKNPVCKKCLFLINFFCVGGGGGGAGGGKLGQGQVVIT